MFSYGEAPKRELYIIEAVYIGVKDFEIADGRNKDNFEYRFSINGAEKTYKIINPDNVYSIQNRLMEGYVYDIEVADGAVINAALTDNMISGTVKKINDKYIIINETMLAFNDKSGIYEITALAGGADVKRVSLKKGDTACATVDGDIVRNVYKKQIAERYVPPVKGIPGEKTLKNLIGTALEPVGAALYVYGGGWDWQDENSSNRSMTIGLPQSWTDFFNEQGLDYNYRNDSDPAHSYYGRHYNEYYYGGLDCSGYVGWVLYNVMNTESKTVTEDKGYVASAVGMAKGLANFGWGIMDMGDTVRIDAEGRVWRCFAGSEFKPGDIFSMNGHIWICVGTCDDESIVILHSTPNMTGGSGVQISAIGRDKGCEAYILADYYMNTYYDKWSERYGRKVLCLPFDRYACAYGNDAGKFSWNLSGLMKDPDGYADMTPADILKELYKD